MLPVDDHEAAIKLRKEFETRRRDRGEIIARMETMSAYYANSVPVVLPELDEDEKPAVANLIYVGIESYSTRIASTMPNIIYPSLHPGYTTADNRARDRRLANTGWWKMNNMKVKVRRRARYYTAYGCAPVSISPVSVDPTDKRKIPFWRVRNPLMTYPAPMLDADSMEPTDCIFVDWKPLSWIQENYPKQASVLATGNDNDTELFAVLEYVDAYETVWCVLGKTRTQKQNAYERGRTFGVSEAEILGRVPNKAEICPVVIPGRISLNGVIGQFDQLTGMYQRAAKLDALNTIAVVRDVFPDEYVVGSTPTGRPEIIQEADGKMGIVGEIRNGTMIQMRHSPGPMSNQSLDSLERNQRLSGLIPADLSGESASNIRTAARGTQLLSSAIDMPIQEAHEIFEMSLEMENLRAVKYDKAYYGGEKSMFFFGRDGKVEGKGDYVPNEVFETEFSQVKYPLPGSDINDLVVSIGQRLGLGTLDVMSAMEMDPTIDDPEETYSRVQVDALRKALLSMVEQRMASGDMDPVVGARLITTMLQNRTPIEKALIQMDDILKKEQADQQNAQAQQPQGQAPQATPEQQPGASVGPTNPPVAPQQGQQPDLQSLLESLHVPENIAGNAPTPRVNVGVGQ